MRYALGLALLALALFAVPLAGQCNAWQAVNHVPGVSGDVLAMTVFDPDGPGPAQPRLAIGGTFVSAGGIAAQRIVAWDPSNGAWSPLGSGMDGDVTALTVLPNGDIVAGGRFTTAGGFPANGIARWDGNTWSPLGSGMAGASSTVFALTVLPNGDLVAGGSFTSAGGVAANHVARWDNTNWSPLGSGVGGSYASAVYALATLPNGHVVVGGYFTTAGGISANHIARWDGAAWSAMGSGVSQYPYAPSVNALAVLPNGNLLVGGDFYGNFAVWNGSTLSTLGLSSQGAVLAVAALPNGDFIAGGTFQDHPRYGIARWDGTAWRGLNIGVNGGVAALAILPDGTLLAGGSFSAVNLGVRAEGIARWDGSSWSALSEGMSPYVGALARLSNGDILAGAGVPWLSSGSAYSQFPVARLSGSTWTLLGMMRGGSYPIGRIRALAELANGDIVVGGLFFAADGVPVSNIARWDGTTWSSLGSGMAGEVMSMILLPNGDLIAGGSFTSAGGVAANRIARWDGTAWSPLGTGLTGYGYVAALALLHNGDLIAAGRFPSAGPTTVNHISRWDGSTWSALGTGMDSEVRSLTTLPSGDLVAGGDFSTAGGIAANYVALWDGNGWSALGAGINRYVYAVAALPSGDLVASAAGLSPTGGVIARWDGYSWATIGAGMVAPPLTWPMAVTLATLPNGDLLAGGTFRSIQGVETHYLARFLDCSPAFHMFGSGCSGSLGVAGIQLLQPPRIGATFQAAITRLPQNAGLLAIGWSRTVFSGGPLPFDLTSLGMPGCALRVSPDVVQFLSGVGSVANWNLPIPNATANIGIRFHAQCLAFDVAANAAGATVSDAAIVTIGL